MNKRLSLLMGISIIFVVISHACGFGQVAMFYWAHRYRPVTSPNFDMVGSFAYYVLLCLRQFSAFSVAAFLLISGFFIAFTSKGINNISWKSVKNRLINLLIPYTIWSIFWIIFEAVLGNPFTIAEIFKLYFTSGVSGPYFYVPLLASLYIISPIIVPVAKKSPRLFLYLCGIIQFIGIVARYVAVFGDYAFIELLVKLTPDWIFYRWILFFGFGLVLGLNINKFKDWLVKVRVYLLVLTPIFYLLSIIEPEIIYRATGTKWFSSPFPFSSLLFSVSFIFLFLATTTKKNNLQNLVNKVGNQSYGIYLLHFIFITIFSKAVYHFYPGLLGELWIFCPLAFVVGLGGPLLAMYIVRKSPVKKYYHFVFG